MGFTSLTRLHCKIEKFTKIYDMGNYVKMGQI